MLVWLLRDLDLLAVFLHALVFSFEALTLGGVAFLLLVLLPLKGPAADAAALTSCRRWVTRSALALAGTQALATTSGAATLLGAGFPLSGIAAIGFFKAGELVVCSAILLALCVRVRGRPGVWASTLLAMPILGGAVMMSHAASRMDHRVIVGLCTLLHHLGSAGWLGAMAFLLLILRRPGDAPWQLRLSRRYSALALGSVVLLVAGGVGMSWYYVGSWPAAYGTSYGVLLGVKIVLTAVMLMLGAANLLLLRAPSVAAPLLVRLGRFTEAEIGLGFTLLLAAASLTSQSPAVDVPASERADATAIAERLRWVTPHLSSPGALSLAAPVTTMEQALRSNMYAGSVSDATDRAWSEYNHHWAGLVVLAAAALALSGSATPAGSRVNRLARGWPLLFLGLAAFIVVRADPENWPLGPRGFWESFAAPDVLEHRTEALLIGAFAFFEWAVRSDRLRAPRAAYVFPLVCAGGGALLLTHAHSMGDARAELLTELSHAAVAVLGILAGWSRWLELRASGKGAHLAAWIWPLCLLVAGLVLLDYRES